MARLMPNNFLNRLNANPYAPIDAASIDWIDDAGNGRDAWGKIVAHGTAPTQPQSWSEMGINALQAPVRMGAALLDSINPYQANEHPITNPNASNWRVPPLAQEAYSAFTFPTRALNEGVTEDDINRSGQFVAGAMMGGGGIASGRLPAVAANASKEAGAGALANALDMSPEARLARAREMGFEKVYHGSNNDVSSYDAFDTSDRSLNLDIPNPRGDNIGGFFAENRNHSKDFGSNVRAYGVALKNPRVFATQDDFRAFIKENSGRSPDVRDSDGFIVEEGVFQHNARNALESQGYDGVVIKRPNYTKSKSSDQPWKIAFHPHQVRDWERAAFDPSKSDSSNLLAANASKEAGAGAIANALDERPGIIAYHGSPHDFDRFSLEKIGTGEGAQAYGYGLYFAENEKTAKWYKDQISDGWTPVYGQQTWDHTNPQHQAAAYVDYAKGDRAAALKRATQQLDSRKAFNQSDVPMWQEVVDILNSDSALLPKSTGHMYQVRINANPEDFLDWDKPLSQQSEKVRGAIGSFVDRDIDKEPGWGKLSGERAYGALVERLGRRTGAENALREAGIPGIRYLDQMSRGAGDGSRNLVVFDDNLIEILKKYGWLAPGANLGSNALSQGQDNQY